MTLSHRIVCFAAAILVFLACLFAISENRPPIGPESVPWFIGGVLSFAAALLVVLPSKKK